MKKLQQFLPVDIFGGCGKSKGRKHSTKESPRIGPFNCPKPTANCIAKLDEEYRFYLALENSVCTGYITEKLWEQVCFSNDFEKLSLQVSTKQLPHNR